jgi:hypothetical protein
MSHCSWCYMISNGTQLTGHLPFCRYHLARETLTSRATLSYESRTKLVGWISSMIGDLIKYIELQMGGVYEQAALATAARQRAVLLKIR